MHGTSIFKFVILSNIIFQTQTWSQFAMIVQYVDGIKKLRNIFQINLYRFLPSYLIE